MTRQEEVQPYFEKWFIKQDKIKDLSEEGKKSSLEVANNMYKIDLVQSLYCAYFAGYFKEK